MNKYLSSSIVTKILSVIFAILLWFVALNSRNPLGTKTVVVPLSQENYNELSQKSLGLYNTSIPQYVNVAIQGRKDAINEISGADFKAIIDFSDIKRAGEYELSVHIINENNGVYIIGTNYKSVKVNIKDIIKKTFQVKLMPEGTVRRGYIITKSFLTPDIVEIVGLEPEVNAISSVVAPLYYEDLHENISTLVNCRFYNANNEELIGYATKFNINASANLEIAKEVAVKPVVEGEPMKYYSVEDKKVAPEKVFVQGPSDALKELGEISTVPYNIEGQFESVNATVGLQLPEGVTLYDQNTEIALSVIIEKLPEREYSILKDQIRIYGRKLEYTYNIITPDVSVKLVGKSKDAAFNLTSVIPSISVNYLEEGVHEVPLALYVPDQLMIDGEYTVTVEINRIASSEDTEENESNENNENPTAGGETDDENDSVDAGFFSR